MRHVFFQVCEVLDAEVLTSRSKLEAFPRHACVRAAIVLGDGGMFRKFLWHLPVKNLQAACPFGQ